MSDVNNLPNLNFNTYSNGSIIQKQVSKSLEPDIHIPNYKNTSVYKLETLLQEQINNNKKLNETNQELVKQNQKLQYIINENKLLNKQLQTTNITIERQEYEIEALRDSNDKLVRENKKLIKNTKQSMITGIIIGLIPSLIAIIIDVILTYYKIL